MLLRGGTFAGCGKMLEESMKTPGMAKNMEYIEMRAKNLKRYSDKLSSAIRVVDKYFEKVGPTIGLKLTDKEVFYSEYKDQIGKVEYKLRVSKASSDCWGLWVKADCEYIDTDIITDVSRAMKKAAIKRLPAFIEYYSDEVANLESDYHTISDIAEKIASIMEAK
jgi:hypothetical protein